VYKPIVFTSNGYDSPTCATLGKEIGCNKAIVFESKKSRIDTGKPIVELLGYDDIVEKNELDYLKTNRTEEFVANGELGTSIYYSAVEEELKGTFVLVGGHGDWIWDKHVQPNTEILRNFFPGTSRKEYRLRDRKSTRLNSSHVSISYAVFCLKKKKTKNKRRNETETTKN